MSDLKASLIAVADTIAARANAADQPAFAEQIDALKALTAAYTALQKHPADTDDEVDTDFNFASGGLEEETANGGTTVRTRRRPGN